MLRATILAAVMIAACWGSAQRPERNAFLNAKITSVSALIAQMKSDPEVRDRFQRHYAMTVDDIESYFATFRIGKIKTTGLYRVYGVPEDGRIHETVRSMKAGALVFVDLAGVPVMRMYCGNPMTLGPKEPVSPNQLEAETIGKEETTLQELEAAEELAAADLAGEPSTLEPTTMPLPGVDVPEVAPQTIETGYQAPQIRLPSASFNLGRILPALLVLTPLPRNGPGGTPIPEPTALAVLGVGAAGLLLRRRR